MDLDLIKYSLLKNKKDAQNISSLDLVHEEPFGYRVAHHGYLLTSCPGQTTQVVKYSKPLFLSNNESLQ